MIRDIRLSDVPTILGSSNNPSPWELWNICAGHIEEPPRFSAASDWRRMLKDAAVAGIQSRYRCTLTKTEAVDPPASCVRLYDLLTITSQGDLPLVGRCDALLLKQVSGDVFNAVWKRPAGIEAPLADIAKAQLYMQAYNLKAIAIFVLAGGGENEGLVELSYDPVFAADIADRVNAFRQSILDNNEPSPDFKVDWKALEARYLPTIAAPPLDLRDRPEITAIKDNYTTAVSRKSAHSRVGKEIDAEVEERKAQLKSVLGNHASAILSDGSSVAFKQINVKEQRRPPSSYQRIDIQPAGGQLN
ncbi:MAG TPA: hypothetical protein P5256_00935 [Beijerinckiaceae bacterium]|nr:hypothetical protein [Rhodoblastus sp.]MCB1533371.1 hypothetical protein [Rhodoblastus sp.]MCC2106092.1 hypothetical protein [Hyphomicrobiales bacterium]HRY01659.1 hypothetical protein [Beijerinckiaceae bacterium]